MQSVARLCGSGLNPTIAAKHIFNPDQNPYPKSNVVLRIKIHCCNAHENPALSILESLPRWADSIKEAGMRKPKSLYTRDDWVRHRSSARHIRHVMSSLSSRVILSLVPPVCIFTTIAAVIASYNTAVILGWIPSFMPMLHSSSLPCQLTAPALALLLVFRTEASYSRYEEGKKTWTKLIGGAVDFARSANICIQDPDDAHLKDRLLRYIMALPLALKCHIIYGSDFRNDIGNLLQEDDLSIVLSSQNPPNCIIQLMSDSLRQVQLSEHERSALDLHISQFIESIAVCERLIGTPIPLSYTRLTSRFLVLWHITLPIILWDECQWIVVPATFASAASLFCIEEVGVLIEEPFPMLPLDKICSVAHDNIREMLEIHKLSYKRMHTKKENLVDGVGSNGIARINREENLKI